MHLSNIFVDFYAEKSQLVNKFFLISFKNLLIINFLLFIYFQLNTFFI